MAPDKRDATCPICLCIFIEPVTMPCKHSLCMPCYKQVVEKANLCCPLCRLRISVWARKSSKMNCLIDVAKWDAVRSAFPEEVQNRLEGKEDLSFDNSDDADDDEKQLRRLMELSKPGEIRQEYEAALQQLQYRREAEARQEEEASAALIKAIQQEEEKELEELERMREELDKVGRETAEKLVQSESEQKSSAEQEPKNMLLHVTAGSNSRAGHKPTSVGVSKGKKKQVKKPVTASLTLNTFFGPVHQSDGALSPDVDVGYNKKYKVYENEFESHSFSPFVCTDFLPRLSDDILTSKEGNNSSSCLRVSEQRECSDIISQTSDLTRFRSKESSVAGDVDAARQPYFRPQQRDKCDADPSGLAVLRSLKEKTASVKLTDLKTLLPASSQFLAGQTVSDDAVLDCQPSTNYDTAAAKQLPMCSDSGGIFIRTMNDYLVVNEQNIPPSDQESTKSLNLPPRNCHRVREKLNICSKSSQNPQVCRNGNNVKTGSSSESLHPIDVNVEVLGRPCPRSDVYRTSSSDCQAKPHLGAPLFQVLKPEPSSVGDQDLYSGESSYKILEKMDKNVMQTTKPAADHVTGYVYESNLTAMASEDIKSKDDISSVLDDNCNYCSAGVNHCNRDLVCDSDHVCDETSVTEQLVSDHVCDKISVTEQLVSDHVCDETSVTEQLVSDHVRDKISVTEQLVSDHVCDKSSVTEQLVSDRVCDKSSVIQPPVKVQTKTSVNREDRFDQMSKAHSSIPLQTEDVPCSSKGSNNQKISRNKQCKDMNTCKDIKKPSHKTSRGQNQKKKNSSVTSRKAQCMSITRWCVPDRGRAEGENKSQMISGRDSVTDKSKSSYRQDKKNLDYSVKRKHSTSGDESEFDLGGSQHLVGIFKNKSRSKGEPQNSKSVASERNTADGTVQESVDEAEMSQEELDYLFAVRLQEMYVKLDKKNISVDRFEGSKHEYSFRKRQKKK